MASLASVYHLPKSNQAQEDGISQGEIEVATGADDGFDRRSIPASARESMWHAPDGHAIRRLDWTAPPKGVATRGALLFMAGRGDSYEKYLEAFEHWRMHGWQVTAADWRGQGGSGRLGKNNAGHIDDFSLWVGDLAQFWTEWTAETKGPHVLVGHSMGGHLALRAVIDQALEPAPDALVLTAPMLDVLPEHAPGFVKRGLAKAMMTLGDPMRPAWGKNEKPVAMVKFRQDLLTHSTPRYEDETWWRKQRPELVLGAGSWGWVNGAMNSVAAIFRRGALEGVDVPVLIVATNADKLVSPAAIRAAIARLPDVESKLFGAEARHEILREVDEIRLAAHTVIDDFLTRRVGA